MIMFHFDFLRYLLNLLLADIKNISILVLFSLMPFSSVHFNFDIEFYHYLYDCKF
jgi:hypothetical protein